FVAVCNIIAFAHDRGIIHRDLKPSNIMLGKFGETLVVDWGLAKALGGAEPASAEGTATAERSAAALDDGPATGPRHQPMQPTTPAGARQGWILGTPAFLSPGQACGRLDRVGPASDIFGLGATLYNLLVGRPPYVDSSVSRMLRRAQKHELI